jgi:hypothetical protein
MPPPASCSALTPLHQGFPRLSWMTFKQALELKANVRKGEKGSLVVYANSVTKTEQNDAGEDVAREVHFLKGYTVFNCDQIEGLPEQYYVKPEPKFTAVERIEHTEAFFASTRADIRYRGGRAYYAQEPDYIQMPPIDRMPPPRPLLRPPLVPRAALALTAEAFSLVQMVVNCWPKYMKTWTIDMLCCSSSLHAEGLAVTAWRCGAPLP